MTANMAAPGAGPLEAVLLIGGNLRDTARIVQEDLGVEADVEESAAWLLERTRQLFACT